MEPYIRKLLILTLFISILTLGSAPSSASSATEFEKQLTTDRDKYWTVNFSEAINPSSFNKDVVHVKTDEGKTVEQVTLDFDTHKNEGYVFPPVIGYEQGIEYTLTIDKEVTSQKGREMAQPVIMKFEIVDTLIPEGKQEARVNSAYGAFIKKETNKWNESEYITQLNKHAQAIETMFENGNLDGIASKHAEALELLLAIDRKIDYIGWSQFDLLGERLNTLGNLNDKIKARYEKAADVSDGSLYTLNVVTSRVEEMKTKVSQYEDTLNYVKPANPVEDRIYVEYGEHDYSVMNQEEYELVMDFVTQKSSEISDQSVGGKYEEYFMDYLNGERWSGDRTDRSERNMGLKFAENEFYQLTEYNIPKDDIIHLYKAREVVDQFGEETLFNRAGSYSFEYWSMNGDESLEITKENEEDIIALTPYDLLERRVNSSRGKRYVAQAFFDHLGYNTMIRNTNLLIELEGEWFSVLDSFRQFDRDILLQMTEQSPPTNGPFEEVPEYNLDQWLKP
ncbi:Ig-like domain-containing protein [Halobacillus litoralis]|uniref:Ig-like domain-containing protein n=1 Tax=Halobacillus litoralis TaxID=45668 RepID=UPI001CD2FB41|nr:Ig-like domain-containing protein [Halobacillus litoralis]MCA0971360.1 Ig-like domain-containing protein [Halobacillus litoralis]